MLQHLSRHVAGQRHDGAVAGLGFGQLRDGVMAQIVKSQTCERTFDLRHLGFAHTAVLRGVLQLFALGAKTPRVMLRHAVRQLR